MRINRNHNRTYNHIITTHLLMITAILYVNLCIISHTFGVVQINKKSNIILYEIIK